MFIPVDHYYVIKQPLADMVNWYLGSSLADYHNNKLIIGNVTYWEDKNPIFSKGPILNGYTKLVDENGKTIKDWQWEIRVKKSRNKKTEEIIGDLLADWMNTQKASLTNIEPNPTISPFPYCRQLLSWFDIIYLSDGYIIDARLSLDFPTDQMDKYIRGVRGIYYRRSSRHESIAIGGKDQQWYYRLNRSWLGRLNVTGRLGFNNFNTDKFDYLDWWNIFLINVGMIASVEFRPVYYKELFAGFGIHQSINILPEVVKRFDTGLLLTIGVVLP